MKAQPKSIDYMLEAYRDILSLARQLRLISESMSGLVHNAQTEQIERVIKRRNEIITQIRSMEDGLLPQRKRWASLWKQMRPHAQDKMQSLVDGIRETILTIQALDKEVRALLNDDKEKVAGMMKKVSHGHRLIKGYTPFRMGVPRYLSHAA
jgi:hypothetical protein